MSGLSDPLRRGPEPLLVARGNDSLQKRRRFRKSRSTASGKDLVERPAARRFLFAGR